MKNRESLEWKRLKELIRSKYNTYYLLPWPECQEVQDTAPREFWSFTDADTHTGIFIEKNWFDLNRDKYGL